jgi:NAD(P)-dependent dehydrogenase (short-subunit alcohol dehydrogenase family)
MEKKPTSFPEQNQEQPGIEQEMDPRPEIIRKDYQGSNKLVDMVALITGGDSGNGRSVAVHFAREGADVAIIYLNEDKDARETKEMVESEGRKCILFRGNIREEEFCKYAVNETVNKLGRLDILVNNAAEQHETQEVKEVTTEQMIQTFETNIFPHFYFVKEAMQHLKSGSSIINSTSVTAYRGSSHLLDYASTKGAIVSFTRSLSKYLAEKGIRVNGVAPGPIWTPLIPATFENVEEFGKKVPMGRAGQPSEVGPTYVFLASKDASYITGQVIHVNGGEVVGG